MRIIELDGSAWQDGFELFCDLADALGAFDGHGIGYDAFIDTMVYSNHLLAVQPPYVVHVINVHENSRSAVANLAQYITGARKWRRANWGDDVEVSIKIVGDS